MEEDFMLKSYAYTVHVEPAPDGGFVATVPAFEGCTVRAGSYALVLQAARDPIEDQLAWLNGTAPPAEDHAEAKTAVLAAEQLVVPEGFSGSWSVSRSSGTSCGRFRPGHYPRCPSKPLQTGDVLRGVFRLFNGTSLPSAQSQSSACAGADTWFKCRASFISECKRPRIRSIPSGFAAVRGTVTSPSKGTPTQRQPLRTSRAFTAPGVLSGPRSCQRIASNVRIFPTCVGISPSAAADPDISRWGVSRRQVSPPHRDMPHSNFSKRNCLIFGHT